MSKSPAKFIVNQTVTIAHKASTSVCLDYGWHDASMDRTLGEEAYIRESLFINAEQAWVHNCRIPSIANSFWYLESCLEALPCPKTMTIFTAEVLEPSFEDVSDPDYILQRADQINFGGADFDVWELAFEYIGKAVKDIVSKSVHRRSGEKVTHVPKVKMRNDFGDHWYGLTNESTFPGGSEIYVADEGWRPSGKDGEPVPPYVPGEARPLYRIPRVPCGNYVQWIPSGPGEVRPEGLEYRSLGSARGTWKPSKVVGKPVEEADIADFIYRIPKGEANAN